MLKAITILLLRCVSIPKINTSNKILCHNITIVWRMFYISIIVIPHYRITINFNFSLTLINPNVKQ